MKRGKRPIPLLERLRRRTVVDEVKGCWLWTGSINPRGGHGKLRMPGRRLAFVHRAAYELLVGPIPDGMNVLHRCDVGRCFNPAHLFLGTIADNNEDMWAKGRDYAVHGEQHCRAKLTREQVIELRARAIFKGACALWAKEFGVAERTVYGVVHRRTWKHV